MANRARRWRRLKHQGRQRAAPGSKPGTLTIEPGAYPTTIRVMAYDTDRLVEQVIDDPRQLKDFLEKWPVVWVDVAGLGTEDKLRSLADIFQMHPLAIEDV